MKRKSICIIILILFIFISCSSPTDEQPYTGKVYGSKNSNVYHTPSCHYVNQINSSNLISFSSPSAAEEAGYRACLVCF